MNKTKVIFALVVMLGGGLAAPLCQGAAPAQYIEIPAGELREALIQLSKRYGVDLFYRPELVQGLRTNGVKGRLTTEEAVRRLIEGTSLKVSRDVSGAMVIQAGREGAEAATAGPVQQMRLAATTGATDDTGASSGESEPDRNQVVVRDSKTKPAPFSGSSLDLTRTEDDVLPYTVFTAEDLKLSGAVDLHEFLRNRLPQNIADETSVETDTIGVVPRNSVIDMRGWGPAETVILLNGRRLGAEYGPDQGDTTNAAPNLRGIPLASIERIEILSSAGSAIYGANATGGVINIITRRDYRGGQLSLNYETPEDVLRPRKSATLYYGTPLKWGMSLRLSGHYSDVEPLLVSDRADVTISRYRRLAMERDPQVLIAPVGGSSDFTSTVPPLGARPNIRANSNTIDLFAGLSGVSGSNFTTVPDGFVTGSRADFQPGVFDLELAEGTGGYSGLAKGSQLSPVTRNASVDVGLIKDFNERWRWSVDYRHTRTEARGQPWSAPSFRTTPAIFLLVPWRLLGTTGAMTFYPVVPAETPTSPFRSAPDFPVGRELQVTFADPQLAIPGLGNTPRNVTREVSSTLHGQIGAWRGFFDVALSRNESRYESRNYLEPIGGWEQAFLTGAYNPFVDPRVAPYAAPEFYRSFIMTHWIMQNTTETRRSMVKASGPVYQLPAGAVELTAGLEWARTSRGGVSTTMESIDSTTGMPRDPSYGPVPPSTLIPLPFVFVSQAAYAEANLPLVASKHDFPLVERLEAFMSARIDRTINESVRSESDPTEVKYKNSARIRAYGVRYLPFEGLAFRASRSVGFKPPSMTQVTPSDPPAPTTAPTNVTDPRRNGEIRQITYDMFITGGNPDLRPETTDSVNFGLILTPRWIKGLRLSLDYLESIRDDAIFNLSAQEAVNLELEFPGIVQRGPADGQGVGPITFIDRRYINLRQIRSRSLDISLQQSIENVGPGRLILGLSASKNISFKVQTSNLSAPVEQVRNNSGNFASRQIKWNGNAQLRWDWERWGFGWSARLYDFLLISAPFSPTSINYAVLQGSDRAPRVLEHDFSVSYQAPAQNDPRGAQWWLSGLTLNFGIKNVFDREPRFWAHDAARGVAPYDFGAVNGRSLWMRISKDFR